MTKTRSTAPPRRERRKQDRPAEIVAAALQVFADKGFGAAKIIDVAQLAGVSKATVFVYFPTKEDLFRAVARTVVSVNFERLRTTEAAPAMPLATFVPLLLQQAATLGESRIGSIARMLIGESRSFPDLAKVWHDEVVAVMLGILTSTVARAQARGEVRAGDPRLIAFSIFGPMMAGVLFREVFGNSEAELPDLRALARQHSEIVLAGLSTGADA
ncbi:MAG: TetR/AcrR family transcriptional regulator [Burkholderiales bacterium]|nr:TetR/AcrR family transcriptional regulator [Burkholderiales bacterium]